MKKPVSAAAGVKSWPAALSPYREARMGTAALELGITLLPFLLLWSAAAALVHAGYWIGMLLVLPAAAFLVRIFMIQHDCGHGSFFGNRRIDDWTGRILGVLTLTPYDYWRRSHAKHHAQAGNLDGRGDGDITTYTVREFQALSPRGRLGYRLYRHPLVMFGIGPAWIFLLKQRLPFGMMRDGSRPWISTMGTNLAIAALAAALIWAIGPLAFLMVFLPTVLLAALAGVWLFYVQHQFEETHWSRPPEWQFQQAALHGASHYVLPPVLRWFSANIGVHHVHHLASRIPYYRLPEVLKDHPELADINRITIRESLRCVPLTLWDEEAGKMVTFREARTLSRAPAEPSAAASSSLAA